MKSRRIVVFLLILAALAVMLSGCGGKTTSTSPGPTGPSQSASPQSASPQSASPQKSTAPQSPATQSAGPSQSASPSASSLEAPQPANAKFAEHIEVISDSTPIGVLNPFAAAGTGNSTNWVYGMVYDTLLKYNYATGEALPNLATSWKTADYKTFEFKLRNDVTWHNGDKFTAKDIVYTWTKAMSGGGGFPSWDYWNRIEKATAVDDYTLQLVTKTVNVDFYYGISLMYCGIVNERAVTADPEKGYWIGTGAYKVTGFSSKDFVKFERNDKYWGKIPATKTMTWKYIPEMTTRTIMLQNGEADICFELADADISVFSKNPKFALYKAGGLNPTGLNFNQDDPLMADKNFRLAVLYALDRDEVAVFANGELAIPLTDGALWGRTNPHRNTSIPLIKQDLAKAKQYLASSSYKGQAVVLTTAINYNIKAAEAIQQQLAKAGIKITINQLDIAGFTSATTWKDNKTQMNIWTNLLGASPFGFLNNFQQGAVHNRSKLTNSELETLLKSIPTMTDVSQRDTAWKKAQQIVYDNTTCIPLCFRGTAIVGKKGIGGLFIPSNLLIDVRYMYLAQ